MGTVGTVYLNGCNYQVGYDLISQSTANNTSTVKFWGKLNVTNNYISWSSGSASTWGKSVGIGTYYSKGSHTLVTNQVTITHKADGTYSATLSGSLSTTFVSGTAKGTFSLPTIPRASQPSINTYPNNSPNFNIGDTITIHMNRASSSFTHKVVFKLNSYSYTIAASGVTNNVQFNTSTIADNIYAQIPNSTVANGTIEVTTYSGSTTVGTKSCDFAAHAVNVNPTFSAAYLDTNSTTVGITGNNQKIIQNKSTLQINATSLSAKKSASLSSIKAVINGTTYTTTISGTTATFDIGTLNISSNITAAIILTDSRGLTATNNLNIQMLQWSTPTAIITAERESNFYNPTTVKADANYSSLDGHNTIEILMRYKKRTDSSYSSFQTLQDNTPVTIDLDNNYQWDVQVLITDELQSKTYNVVVERGIPIIFFDKSKRSVGINKFPNYEETLEISGDLIVADNEGENEIGVAKGIIQTGFIANSNYAIQSGQNNLLPLTKVFQKKNVFEITNDGGVKCLKSGIVLVNAQVHWQTIGSTGIKWVEIWRNTSSDKKAQTPHTLSARGSVFVSGTIFEVNANDVIYLNTNGQSGDYIAQGSTYTYMSVEYIG